jgi:DNA (cytosine-5)-methyltransferase 1
MSFVLGSLNKRFVAIEANLLSVTVSEQLLMLQTVVPPAGLMTLTEEILLLHAQFVCDQVLSFDKSATENEDMLITSPCMRALVKMSGVNFSKR